MAVFREVRAILLQNRLYRKAENAEKRIDATASVKVCYQGENCLAAFEKNIGSSDIRSSRVTTATASCSFKWSRASFAARLEDLTGGVSVK